MERVRKKPHLLVMGVHLDSEGYPNTRYRLRDIRGDDSFQLSEINVPMWTDGTQSRTDLFRLGRSAGRALFAHAAVICRFLFSKKPDRIYIPYPAVFLLFFLSFLPAGRRPRRVIADAFISLYDTIVNDRNLIKRESLFARLLKRIEKRAYHFADALIVDTPQNAQFLADLFGLPPSKLEAIPLSTDEIHFRTAPYRPKPGICQVLFIGTMVPLHGIGTILEAAELLADRPDIRFALIGDGQDGELVKSWMDARHSTIEWERNWQTSEEIAQRIVEADICLGIFGAGAKTQRVCPFKIYAYAAVGRPIITGETAWVKEAVSDLAWQPFACVPVNDAKALASKIAELADQEALRNSLAENGREFYARRLSNHEALEKLKLCLLEA